MVINLSCLLEKIAFKTRFYFEKVMFEICMEKIQKYKFMKFLKH